MAPIVVVVGSINVDLVVRAPRLPRPGETVRGGQFEEHFGGKGANQAVAAARAGARVAMIGAVGDDERGAASVAALEREGVDVSHVRVVPDSTGVALIAVGERGENQIMLAPGANELLAPEDVELPAEAAVVLTSFEIPMATATAAVTDAARAGITAIVTPAPAHALPAELLAANPILVPNEHELVVSIGNDRSEDALEELTTRTAGPVIITQGPAGALLARGSERERFTGRRAPAVVDTTGAGDAFVGALAAWLSRGATLDAAIEAANAAGALSVAALGARNGLPAREAIEVLLGEPLDEV
jgi:ribokinase